MTDLLPGGAEVAFRDLPATAETAIATVVIVAPHARVRPAAEALAPAVASGSVRPILIVADPAAAPSVRVSPDGVLLEGLKAEHVNNAVAALRLSSLPTLVWWRGGPAGVLTGLAALADRLVLDTTDPPEVWPLVSRLAEQTAVTDIRWAGLTRWRTLLAHFFDIPRIRDAAASFHTLSLAGGDPHAAQLFAGWLRSTLGTGRALKVDIEEAAGAPALQSARLGNGHLQLTHRLAESGRCVVTSVEGADAASASRTVSLGDQSLAALIAEELRIRSRDVTFERAVQAIEERR
jgi:glucose-6-phosphate dehydrogenase assembly protein OpcA